MRLLQSTWAEMLSLMLAYRSMSGATGSPLRLRFATDLALDEQQARDIGAHDLFTQVCGTYLYCLSTYESLRTFVCRDRVKK